jgi:DNA mismatch endonuclease (patch repair protein)
MERRIKQRCPGRVRETDPTRSWIMSQVRGTGNLTTELRLIDLMRTERITGWRRGVALAGRPDFVFRERRVVVFVDGCFWHGCRCKRLPTRHRAFWKSKLERNRLRDANVSDTLRKAGWQVIRIWEHELKKNPRPALERLTQILHVHK